MDITITADAVAWYGAIVATIVGIFGILSYLNDRIHITVECQGNYELIGDVVSPYKRGIPYMVLTVRNKGRYPVTIDKAGFLSAKKKGDFVLTESMNPREVTPGKCTEYLVEQDPLDVSQFRGVFAYDQTGRKYTGKIVKQK